MQSQLRELYDFSPYDWTFSPLLPPAPGQSPWSWGPEWSKERAFQAPFDLFSIWLTLLWTFPMRFPAISALLSQHTWTTCLLDLVPSQHVSSPSAFATAHSENEKQALEGGLGSLSADSCVPPPHPVRVTYWSQCAALSWVHRGHLWFAGIQMSVYEACLAAKGQALSQLLQPLSWVYFLLWVSALTCARLWGVFLCVWICDLQIPSCAVEVLLSGQQGERSLCLYSVRVCFTEP